jgi:nucleotide-binding universal stress UspA family protein
METARVVMAVFSGTELDRALFERALSVARRDGARLVLADVRHQHRADRLAESLTSQAFLPPAAVEALKQSVKEQRTDTIRRSLASMRDEAEAGGVAVEVVAEKGSLRETVRRLAAERGVDTVVIDAHSAGEVGDGYEVVAL